MKPFIRQVFYIVLLAGIISCQSCKKKFECTAGNNVPIPQIMKGFFYYKVGSWWVYYNIKTNAYDSMWVSQSSSNIYRGEGKEGFGDVNKCYEHTVMGIVNKRTVDFMRWDLSNFVLNNNQRFGFTIYWRDPSTNVNKDLNLFFSDGIIETYNPVRPLIISTPDSTTIQNNRYNNLIEVDAYNFYYDNIKYRLFAKHVGLIKYIDRDSNQWELVKCNIIQ